MLNGNGGTVLIGVKDDGRFADFTMGSRTDETIAQHIRDLSPVATVHVSTFDRSDGRHLVELRVESGLDKPYSYKNIPYKRILNSTSPMSRTESEQWILVRHHATNRWETLPAPGMTVQDLNVVELREFITESIARSRLSDPQTSDPLKLMESLELAQDGVILRAGAASFGNETYLAKAFPQCRLSFAKFRSRDTVDPEQLYHIEGNIFHLLRKAETLIRDNMAIFSRIRADRMQRDDLPEYPSIAVREALANAFIHRDYAITGASVQISMFPDRLEILSPGPLHFGLTVDRLMQAHPSRKWNPNLARILYRRGLIDEFGTGINRMFNALKENGNPEPELSATQDSVTVIMFSNNRTPLMPPEPKREPPQYADWRYNVYVLLAGADYGVSRSDVFEMLGRGYSANQVYELFRLWREHDVVRSIGRGPGAKWFKGPNFDRGLEYL